ncbi:DUF2628 domain-containing protein [Snodgrassella alvi]|nr:DUF2628 domain-containing protein [Snodgrassella alvi]
MDENTEKKCDFSDMGLSDAWLFRFKFYEENGIPKFFKQTDKYVKNLRSLPFKSKMTMMINWKAFFFGPFYYFYLGMWRKALTILLFLTVLDLLLILLLSKASAGCADAIFWAFMTNPIYYVHRTKKSKSFNPFEGMQL